MKTLNRTQDACLEAMGIDVWVSRHSEVVSDDSELEIVADVVEAKENAIDSRPVALESDQPISIPEDWQGLQQTVSSCQLCSLHKNRNQTVFGFGNQQADWLIIGDVPSSDDDASGQIFSGESGNLLTAMLRAIGLSRQQVYLSNIVKCMPVNNMEVTTDESDICIKYLQQQIKFIQPKLILVLGQLAAQRLMGSHSTLARLRQKIHTLDNVDTPIIVTYHPSSLLSMPHNKRDAWQDLLFAQKTISTETVL